jgi:hypothetical protein
MGNIFPTNEFIDKGNHYIRFFSLDDTEDCDYHKGSKRYIMVFRAGNKNVQNWLRQIYGEDGLIKVLEFTVSDPIVGFMRFCVDKAKNNFINDQSDIYYHHQIKKSNIIETKFVKETKNHLGGVTKTLVACRKIENEGSLFVVEQKTKRGVEKPCAVKVVYYYAISTQNFITRKKYDLGFSMVVDVKVLNNEFDVSWRGYSEHPSFALLEMFDQVYKTWNWKWTSCRHCAAQTHMQQFETETENNDDEERNNLQQPTQIIESILTNKGVIIGNNSANLTIKQLNIVKRWFN